MTPLLLLVSALLAHPNGVPSSSSAPPKHVFIGGLGYCGSRIASSFHSSYPECIISGTVRSTERRDAMLSSPPSWLTGSVHVMDLDDSYTGLLQDGVADLVAASHVIQTIAPIADFDRDPLLALHGDELSKSKALQYVGYISSTGVYGDYGGDWVTEESELRCVDAKSKARVLAEQEWSKLESSSSTIIGSGDDGPRVDCFRCGGIYGPKRGPLFSSIASLNEALAQENTALAATSTRITSSAEQNQQTPKYVNRILVDDICGALIAAVAGDRPRCGGRAYNLVDDDPAPRRAVVAEARRLLAPRGVKEFSQSENERVSKAATSNTRRLVTRATGNKRCENSRLKQDYGWSLKAPTYREGLALLLKNSDLKL